MNDEERDEMYAQVSEKVPLGRVGEVEDAALADVSAMTQTCGAGVAPRSTAGRCSPAVLAGILDGGPGVARQVAVTLGT
jgi:hypothetical protein